MPTPSRNQNHSPVQPTPPDSGLFAPPHLTALAHLLQQTAQSLLAFSSTTTPTSSSETASKEQTNHAPSDQEVPHQLRCYRIPDFIVRHEQATLSAHKAANLSELLDKVYEDLHVTAYLMEHFDQSVEVEGSMLQVLGGKLQSTLHLLNRVCSIFADYRPDDLPEPA